MSATAAGTVSGALVRRVLVVDDHRTFAELLLRALGSEEHLRCVGHVQSAAAARGAVQELSPDLVLTDVELGHGTEDGISLTRSLTAAYPELNVVVLTGFADGDLVRRAAAAGASGVVPKDASLREMLDVVRRVVPGSLVLHPQLILRTATGGGSPRPAEQPVLTAREREVLELLAEGLDARGIASQLGISLSTCRGYVKSLLVKLDAHSQLEAVVTAIRRGLIHVATR